MNTLRLENANVLRDSGKFREAYEEFVGLAENTEDPFDKAWLLLNAAATLRASGQHALARQQLDAIGNFNSISDSSNLEASRRAIRLLELEMGVEFEEATLSEAEGRKEEALASLSALLIKYQENIKDPDVLDLYNTIRMRRAFLLADLGRFQEALPILKAANVLEPSKAQIVFYLGHCYLGGKDYIGAERLLAEALRLGLPPHLEFRAHCELGMAHYELGDYIRAKLELEEGEKSADATYLARGQIWKWLEYTCIGLGLQGEADHYANLARPS